MQWSSSSSVRKSSRTSVRLEDYEDDLESFRLAVPDAIA